MLHVYYHPALLEARTSRIIPSLLFLQQQQQQQHEQQQLAQDEGDGARFSSSSTPQRMPRNQRAETMAEFGDQVDEVVARED
mmetsp:Transcript_1952/g.3574  ORF Transcript_1952/g.3574 Transcript_1952/m.3574 type:complete len:82 (-) Transcript_1952:194-439(-)